MTYLAEQKRFPGDPCQRSLGQTRSAQSKRMEKDGALAPFSQNAVSRSTGGFVIACPAIFPLITPRRGVKTAI